MVHYNIDWLKKQVENGASVKFIHFWGHANKPNEQVGKFCFSQWFPSPFTVDGIRYNTAEHWMMAHKALLFGDRDAFHQIIECSSPGEAKKLGRQVRWYDNNAWDEHKCEIVRLGSIHKFNQYPDYATYLLQTGTRVLVEASPRDTIWGIGLGQSNEKSSDVFAWRGKNLLGFALMEARDFLREFGHFQELENAVQPPWKQFPGVGRYDAFWRMGTGEEYAAQFGAYFSGLSEREATIYKLAHPPLGEWSTVYD